MLVTLHVHTVPPCCIQAPYFSALLSAPEADLSGTYVSQVPLLSGSFFFLIGVQFIYSVEFLPYSKSESVIHTCIYISPLFFRFYSLPSGFLIGFQAMGGTEGD